MKKSHQILSFLLALVMVFTIAPATVFAEGETDVLEGWSITLGDDIGVKFYLDSADYTVTATVNGEAVTPAISDNVATVNVAAAQMTDPIVLTVKDADQVVHTGKYSVRQYADTVLNGNYTDKVKDMVKQMLNYGAASQTYFNYNTKNMANKGITVPEVTMPAEPQVSITDNLDGINFYGASLLLRNKTAVRFYFQITDDINRFTFSQGTPVLKDDLYYIEIDGINPQNYADDITLTVNDGALSVTYNPLTYIARKYNHAESSNALKALVQAMYGYHLEAVQYQNHVKNEHADGHTWLDATCIEPKTCSICGAKEGTVSDHTYVEGFCNLCGIPEVIRTEWNMSNKKDAADWIGYHSKVKNEALTTTVTEAGLEVNYLSPGNGWKGIVLEKTLIDISKLSGKLTFTYSSDMAITNYRIHILTGLGGNLTANGTADCYTSVSIADITAGSLAAWTQTVNEDGSITVTFDLSSMGYFAKGTALKGLTIVTVTANDTPGTVTYKSIALELDLEGHDCQADGHIMKEATCTAPATCFVCGATEGEKLGHTDADNDLVCDVCTDDMTIWNMNNPADAMDWSGYHSKVKNEALTTTVTEDGMVIEYLTPGNGWKGIVWEETAINIRKLNGKLTFTYSSDMAIIKYRIHIATDLGGHITKNGTPDCYTEVIIADITAGSLKAWTQTVNADGSITVTFDLTTMGYFANGEELRGLTIVTVTANKTPGTVTYKSIELEKLPEGYDCQVDGHIMKKATCAAPATCFVCGATEGEKLAHTDADNDLVCDVCTDDMTIWNMNNPADAIDWTGYQSKNKNDSLTTTVTEAGLEVNYLSPGNGWKGIVWEETATNIRKLNGKLTFTYSSDMTITKYRIHIATDLGGHITKNGTPDCYTEVIIADITAGSLEAWTQTTNEDGSVTVTFDLSSMGYFANGTELRGLTIVTVTANNTPGTVTYKSIELEKDVCQINGHIMKEATCTEPKTCSVCGATEGEALGHSFAEGICSVCGATQPALNPANVRVLTLNVAYYDGEYTTKHLSDDPTLLTNLNYTNQEMEADYSFAERADRLLSLLEHYDPGVFFLNEFNFAWWQEVISDEDALLKALPKYTYVESRSTGSSRNGEGTRYKDLYNMVFYDQEQFTLLDTGSFVTCQTWNGWYDHCTWAKLEHKESGQTAVYATVHVQTVPSGEQHIERAIKSLQAATAAVEELYRIAEGLPIILGGDFNTTEASRGYRTYAYMVNQAGYKDSRYAAPQSDSSGTARIWGSSLKNNGNRIDYIFVNGASVKKYRVASGSFLKDDTYVEEVTEADLAPSQECRYYDISDHLPIVSDIILKGSQSNAPKEYVDPADRNDVTAAPTGSYTENGGTANKITFNFADALDYVGGVNKQGLTASLVENETYGAVLKLEAESHITAGYISIDYKKLMDAAGLAAVDISENSKVKITYLMENSFTAEGGVQKLSVLRDGESYPTDQNAFELTVYGQWNTETVSCSGIAADGNGLVNALSIYNANGALHGDAIYIAAIEFTK